MPVSCMYHVCMLCLGSSSLYALIASIASNYGARCLVVTFGMIELGFLDSDRRDSHVHLATFHPQSWSCVPAHISGTPRGHELANTTDFAEEGALCYRVCRLSRTLRCLLFRFSVSNSSIHHHSHPSIRSRPGGIASARCARSWEWFRAARHSG